MATKATQPQPATSSSSLGVSFSGLMENKGAAAVPEKEAQAPAALSTCFKWTVGEGATFMERAKDQYKQFTEAQASEHWECIKNTVSSMFAEPIPFFGGGAAKDHGSSSSNSTPPSVESQ
ncbi:hypothetical protein ACQJBY_010951 [Aegilops geniculata]